MYARPATRSFRSSTSTRTWASTLCAAFQVSVVAAANATLQIHHSFTLAELFAMSGFYLTLNTLQTGFSAAEESVRMLDGILGSNETSRALSSIITLVRQELTQDPRFSPAERGAIASLTALTKALTAFVCLQTATHKRSLKEMRLRVVYDCTIVVEGEGERDFSREEMGRRTGQGTTDVMMTDVRSELEATRPRTRTSSAPGTESMEIVNELEQLCGGEEGGAQEEEDLPEEVREALREVQAGQGMRKRVVRAGGGYEYEIELEETTTTTTTTIRTVDASSTPDDSNSLRTLSRKTKDRAGPLPTISASPSSAGRESMVVEEEEGEMQEDEWVEVSTMFGPGEGPASGGEDEEMYDRVQDIPGAFNGKQSVATLTRQDTLDHPEESRQRLQVRTLASHIDCADANAFAGRPPHDDEEVYAAKTNSPSRRSPQSQQLSLWLCKLSLRIASAVDLWASTARRRPLDRMADEQLCR